MSFFEVRPVIRRSCLLFPLATLAVVAATTACSSSDSSRGEPPGSGGLPSGTGGGDGSSTGGGAPIDSSGGGTGNATGGGGGGGDFTPQGATCETFGGQPLDQAFATLYADWKTTQVEICGDGARVKGCPAADPQGTCSEAQAYGMLLAIAASDRDTFDRLNNYRLEMLQQSSTADKSLMPWAIWNAKACPPVAEGGDRNSATDADIDAAMALLQAKVLWGDDAYHTQAITTLNSILALEVTGSGASTRLLPGNHDGDLRDYVAYYTPAYFKVFAELTGENRWIELTDAYYTRLLANQCPGNGQIYDDFQYPGECKFWWDSCRVPWRVALDYAWHQDSRAKQFLDTLAGHVGLDPTSVSDQKNSAYVGGAVLSALSNDDPTRMQTLCDAWANASGLDDAPYFQKTLKLLYLVVASGNFFRPL